MRSIFIALFLAFNACAAFAANPKTDAEYASMIAEVYGRFRSPAEALEVMRFVTTERDLPLLNERAPKFKVLPGVKALGSTLQVKIGDRIENLKVLDGAKNLYELRGVEIDLSPERPLEDRFRQIEELTERRSASFWQWLFPQADAAEEIDRMVAILTAASIPPARYAVQRYHDVDQLATQLNNVCNDIDQKRWIPLRNDFPPAVDKVIEEDKHFGKPKLSRNVSNWQKTAHKILAARTEKYCAPGGVFKRSWHQIRKWIPLNETSETKEDMCAHLEEATACFKRIENRDDPTLYEVQHAHVVKWLKMLDPTISEAQVMSEATTIQPKATAKTGSGASR